MSSINTEVAGIKMKNPTMLASGIMDETGASMRRIVEAGAGAVVTKSIGIAARPGYPGPDRCRAPRWLYQCNGVAWAWH